MSTIFAASREKIVWNFARSPDDRPFRPFRRDRRYRRALLRYSQSRSAGQGICQARRLGFAGKSALHPDQLAVINQIFDVTAEEIAGQRKSLRNSMRQTAEERHLRR